MPLPYQAFDEFGLISIRSSNDLSADVGFWELIVSKKSYKTNEQTTLGIWILIIARKDFSKRNSS